VCGFKLGLASFRSFAAICMTREVITAVKASTRQKQWPLNDSLRMGTSESGESVTLIDLLPSPISTDPVDVLIRKERVLEVLRRLNGLSDLERDATLGIVAGLSYRQMEHLGDHKRIDNAIQRARRRLAA